MANPFDQFDIEAPSAEGNPFDQFDSVDNALGFDDLESEKPRATWGETVTGLGKMLGEVGTSSVGGLLQASGENEQQYLDNSKAAVDRAVALKAGLSEDPSKYKGLSLEEMQSQIEKGREPIESMGSTQYARRKIDERRNLASDRADIGQMMFEKSMERQNEIRPDFTEKDWGKEFVYDVGVAGEQMVPPILVGALTRNPALATAAMGPTVFGNSYGQARLNGRTPSEATQDATAQTAIELGTELPVFGQLFKYGKGGLKKILDTTVLEGISEGVSSLLSTAYDAGVVDDNMTLGEAFTSAKTWKDAGYEALVGGALGGLMGGSMIPSDIAHEKKVIEDLKNVTADMQFTVMSDEALGNAVQMGDRLAAEYGDTELSKMVDVLKAEQALRAEANAESSQVPTSKPTEKVSRETYQVSGLSDIGMASPNAGLDTATAIDQISQADSVDGLLSVVEKAVFTPIDPISPQVTPSQEAVNQQVIESYFPETLPPMPQPGMTDIGPKRIIQNRMPETTTGVPDGSTGQVRSVPGESDTGSSIDTGRGVEGVEPNRVSRPDERVGMDVPSEPVASSGEAAPLAEPIVTKTLKEIRAEKANQPLEQATQSNQAKVVEPQVKAGNTEVLIEGAKKAKSLEGFKSWAVGRFGREKAAELQKTGKIDDAWKKVSRLTNSKVDSVKSSQATEEQEKPDFTPTHELSDGTQVISTGEENVWKDAQGSEYEEQGVTPIADRPVLDEAANEAATSPVNPLPEPTEAQKAAGNYKVGKVSLHGLDISIENPKGSMRRGVDSDGEKWETELKSHYGYIRGKGESADGDHPDVFLGPGAENPDLPVFVVDQIDPKTGKYDESKILLGFRNKLAAKRGYLANYAKGWKGAGAINKMSLDEFKTWLEGDTKKPVSYVEPKKRLKQKQQERKLEKEAETKKAAEGEAARKEKPVVSEPTNTEETGSKSVESNQQEAEEKPKFMRSSKEEGEIKLSALHNLTSENLLFADEIGGLAAPSIGIVKDDMGIEGYGEITLIGKSDLGDPSKEDVYDSDAYSSTFPTPEYKKVKVGVAQSLVDEIRPFFEKYGSDSVIDTTWDRAVNYPDPSEIIRYWNGSNAIKAMFLKEVTGKDTRVPMTDVPLRQGDISNNPLIVDFFKNIPDEVWSKGSNSEEQVQLRKDITGPFRQALVDAYGSVRPELVDEFYDQAVDEDGEMYFGNFDRIRNDQRNIGKKEIDTYKLRDRLDRKIKGKEAQFQKWVTDKVMSMFGEPRLTLRGRKVPYTLENIVDYMTKSGTQAKEDTMTFGPGKARAAAAKKYTDIQWMKNEAEYSLKSSEDIKEEREKADKLLSDWREEVAEYYTEKNWKGDIDYWSAFDDSMKALAYFAKNRLKRGGKSALREGLRNNYFRNVPDDIIDQGIEAGEAMMYAPVPYFESKPKRAVGLDEFAGAVVPKDVSDEVIDVLNKHGIAIQKYGKRYDEDARTKAVIKLRNKLSKSGENVLFKRSESEVESKPLSSKELDSVIERIAGSWKDGPEIIALDSFSGLPESIRKAAEEQGAGANDIHGVSYRGKVYVIRKMAKSAEDVERILFHEAYGHYGISKLFGEDIGKKLNQIYFGIGGSKGLARLAKKYDISLKDYAEGGKSMPVDERRALMAEELLAHIAQDSKPTLARKAKEVLGAIRQWLRSHGLGRLGELSDSEIMYLLKQARESVQTGKVGKGMNNEARFMVAWHGTPHDVDKFNTDKINTGEEKQAFGRGLYFADKKEIAEFYRNSVSYKDVVNQFRDEMPDDASMSDIDDLIDEGVFSEKMQSLLKALRNDDWLGFDYPSQAISAAFTELSNYDPSSELTDAVKNFGNIYQVELAPKPDEYLLWDKPLSEQPENMQRLGVDPDKKSLLPNRLTPDMTGQQVYDALSRGKTNLGVEPTKQAASEYLHSIGIRGIKYLDGTSRGKGEGSFNYVIFNDADVSINARFMRKKPKSQYSEQNAKIREEDKTVWDKAKGTLKRYLTPGGLLPTKVFQEKIARDSEFEVIEFDVRHLVGRLERSVKQAYKKRFEALDDATVKKLSDVLGGAIDKTIPENVRSDLYAMRQYVDRLSNQYVTVLRNDAERLRAEGSPEADSKAELIQIIENNVGKYLHRSYRAFDDKNWFKKVPDDVVDNARDYLISRHIENGESRSEAERMAEVAIHEILKTGTAYDSMETFIKEAKLGAKDLSVLKKRKQISPEIRALLGEYNDPRLAFAKSATKMGRLIWNQMFLERVKNIGMGDFLFDSDTKPPEATKKFAADSSESYSPLNGLWTYPEIEQSFKDALGKEQMANWYRTIVQLNGMVKFGKTILSPTTAMRNWQSAMFFSLANGHFDMRHSAKSLSGLREYFTQQGSGEKLKYLRKLKELGVVYDTPYAGEMMRLLDDSRMEDMLVGKKGKAVASAKWMLDTAQKFYQYGDDFWKIIGFENEKRMLMKHAGMSEEKAEVEAAERIRNTYPTYSMVGKGIQSLRRFPLAGTFVSFPAEIIRTSSNIVKYIAKDMKTPGMRKIAMRRAVGLAIASSFAYALQEIMKSVVGVDDDEEEAVRLLAAPWQRNSNLIFTGRDENGKLQYIDISFVDPYNYWKRPITAAMRDQDWQDSAYEAITESLSPFLGTDIAAGTIFEILANKKDTGTTVYNEHDKPLEITKDIANHLRKSLQPGIVSNVERTLKAVNGERSVSGREYKISDELMAWGGWRVSTLDPKVSLYYRSYDFKDTKREATIKLNRVIRDPNEITDEELKAAWELSEKLRKDAYEDMSKIIHAARKSGLTNMQIRKVLSNSGISRVDVMALMKGEVPKWRPSKTSLQNALKKADTLFDKEAKDRFKERQKELRMLNRQ